ncbi:hypothetical protein B296_00038755 [Ensete ventricosum]|uniref:Uncharacterized protein n=1 Tax=Ensete ventricosum TaxID=4639 RepID=A0A426Y485_ENSVE|nr:hypothetical protein B296_00038755 [Ensete ventricosum]
MGMVGAGKSPELNGIPRWITRKRGPPTGRRKERKREEGKEVSAYPRVPIGERGLRGGGGGGGGVWIRDPSAFSLVSVCSSSTAAVASAHLRRLRTT